MFPTNVQGAISIVSLAQIIPRKNLNYSLTSGLHHTVAGPARPGGGRGVFTPPQILTSALFVEKKSP